MQSTQREIFLKKSKTKEWIKNCPRFKHESSTHAAQLSFVDLFSGCGGLSLGICAAATELGINARSSLAIDSVLQPLKVYESNIPHKNNAVNCCDVLSRFDIDAKGKPTKKENETLEKTGNVDILVAGPPCQGHSDLNNTTRRNDPRNKLYLACIRAVEIFLPDLVIIENVPTVIHSSEGVVQITEERLNNIGYHVTNLNINFLDLGIPQKRRRHVLIATRQKGFLPSLTTPTSRKQTPTLREFISKIHSNSSLLDKAGQLSEENRKRVDYLFKTNSFNLPNSLRPPCHKDKKHSYNSVYGRLNYDKPAQTLTSGYGSMGQGRYIHPELKRTINSREAARIQGFPDSFDFSSTTKVTDLRRMIANAVPPQLTYLISKHYFEFKSERSRSPSFAA